MESASKVLRLVLCAHVAAFSGVVVAQSVSDALPAAVSRLLLVQNDKGSTRENLFDDDKAKANAPENGKGDASTDTLFGVQRTENPTTITGFFDETVAFTYARPAHWSRAVSRLQVAA